MRLSKIARSFCIPCILASLAPFQTAFAAATASGAPSAKPNIIFILCDDLGWGDIGMLYQNLRAEKGLPAHKTPHLDTFASQGVTLFNHYAPAPVCAPSRGSLLLGVHQGHANVRDNQFDKALEDNHTIASVVRRAGYATYAIGKWGVQGKEMDGPDWPAHPIHRGFDQYYGYIAHGDGHEHYPKEMPFLKERKKAKKKNKGLPEEEWTVHVWDNMTDVSPQLDKCYTTDLFTARAKKNIAEHVATSPERPFFLYLAYDTPHAVLQLPTQAYPAGAGLKGGLQWLDKPGQMINTASGKPDSWYHPDYAAATFDHDNNPATPAIAWPDVNKRYATSVRRIDDCVGDIVQLLKDLKIDENTVIVFTSDNGPSKESYLPKEISPAFLESFGPFSGIKRDCLEGGVRVPALVRWPGHVPTGKVSMYSSGFWDWMPTFAEIAGVPAPARTDGVSLLPALDGRGMKSERDFIYVEYDVNAKTPNYSTFPAHHRDRLHNQMQMLRLGNYVGVRYDIQSHADPFEIYDISSDFRQANDLGGKPEMAALQSQMHDKVLQVRRPDSGARRPYDSELIPAVATPADLKPGLQWSRFDGLFPWVPDFAALKASASGIATDLGEGMTAASKGKTFGCAFTGYLEVPADGLYSIALTADTKAYMRLHEASVIDADHAYTSGTETMDKIYLKAGLHPIRLYSIHDGSHAPALTLRWKTAGGEFRPIPATAFKYTR